jgi:hypothetical protein
MPDNTPNSVTACKNSTTPFVDRSSAAWWLSLPALNLCPPTGAARSSQGVRAFDQFNEDNDPHGEHDFGLIEDHDVRCFWKVDYYARDMELMSPDPADPSVTTRVLTVMLADEY